MIRKEIIEFPGKDIKLRGIAYLPEQKSKRGFLFLSSGIKGLPGPNRFYFDFAKKLAEQNYPVFRFDPPGIGDAEWDFEKNSMIDVEFEILSGKYKEDISNALKAFKKVSNVEKITTVGVCSGAFNSLLSAANEDIIDNYICIGLPVLLLGQNTDYFDVMSEGTKHYAAKEYYLRRIMSKDFWINLFRLKLTTKALKHFFIIYKSFFFNRISKSSNNNKNSDIQTSNSSSETIEEKVHVNKIVIHSFNEVIEMQKKALLVFGSKDRYLWEFEEHVLPKLQTSIGNNQAIQMSVINNANHTLSLQTWRSEFYNIFDQWMKGISNK